MALIGFDGFAFVAMVAAVVAVGVAVWLPLELRRRDIDRRRREQAQSLRPTAPRYVATTITTWQFELCNESSEPFSDVEIMTFWDGDPAGRSEPTVPSVGAWTNVNVQVERPDGGTVMGNPPQIELTFTDHQQRRWRRDVTGLVSPLS